MPGPRISVVVPVYNNQAHLGECLASIAAQTSTDLEVIVVNDGSTDASGQIAAAQAAADARFRVLTVPNGGPGSARNQGVQASRGEFLAFVDADDLLPPGAYATMLAALEKSGSDFVSGAVLRLSGARLGESGLHARAIKAARTRTHISAAPELFYDISVWNKLYRRSFWDASGLAFPEGMVWEDLVAMTMAHVLATAVDVITEPIYHWRDRDEGALSITQSRTDITNFENRITALEMIDAFLRDRGTPAMLRHHQHKALVNDLWLYVGDLAVTTDEYRSAFAALGRRYLGTVSRKVLGTLPSAHKLAYHLIAADRPAELAEFAAWLAAQPAKAPPVVRRYGRLRADLPFRAERRLRIPGRVFTPHWRELDPSVQVEAVSWRDGRLVIAGSAYVPSVDIGRRRHTTKVVVLRPAGRRGMPIVTVARSERRPDATARSGQRRYSYEWSGFRCGIAADRFRAGRRWQPGSWDCFILVRGRGVWRPARLHTPGPDATDPPPMAVGRGLTLVPSWAGRRLRIEVRSARQGALPGEAAASPAIDEWSWTPDGCLRLHGRLPPGPGDWDIVLSQGSAGAGHVVPAGRDGTTFSTDVAVGALTAFGDLVPLRDGSWHILMRQRSGQLLIPELGPAAAAAGSATAAVGRKTFCCAATEVAGTAIAGTAIAGTPMAGTPIVRPPDRAADTAHRPLVLTVIAAPVLPFSERGRLRRLLLRRLYYPLQRLLPLRGTVLFISYAGKQCGDNPGGIADELRRRKDNRHQVWVVNDWSVRVPEGAAAVLLGSRAYLTAVARSRYLVANDHMPQPFRKRAGQRYVQTWHGAPLKQVGYDIHAARSASGERYFDFLAADVAQWDLLLSPNPFSTPVFRRAFRFGGDISETGYPRNDVLYGPGAAARAELVRKRLGLPPGRRVVLYAPTWRDDQHDDAGSYRIDFALDLQDAARQLGSSSVLLIRGHHLMGSGLPASLPPGFGYDVTGYPDMADLLLVTSVLVTDYSSVIFDFAQLGRPILFFTYDLARYRDELRGFAFDFEAEAPGPLLASSTEVVAALADIDAVAGNYQNALNRFAREYSPLDDGKSAARACDRIFTG